MCRIRHVLSTRNPILAPGELITQDILDYIVYAKEKGCSMTGPEDMEVNRLNVMEGIRSAAR